MPNYFDHLLIFASSEQNGTRMWASAQRDGRPAEYSWRHLFNARRKVG